MAANQPLDTTIGVVTPENIAFEYQLAGPFRRLPAYLIDVAVRYGVIAVVAIGAMWSIFTFGLNVILPPGMFYNPLN